MLEVGERPQREGLGRHRGRQPADGHIAELVPCGCKLAPLAHEKQQDDGPDQDAEDVAENFPQAPPGRGLGEVVSHAP
jgi:hypothetical protein